MKKYKQEFHFGDLVKVKDDLGSSKSHFTKGCNAIVIYSYVDRFGESNYEHHYNSYKLLFEDNNTSAWYDKEDLVLIKRNPNALEILNNYIKLKENFNEFLKLL